MVAMRSIPGFPGHIAEAVTSAYLEWKTGPGNFPVTDDEVLKPVQDKAAAAFIDRLGDLRQREAARYFKDMAFPSVNGSKS